MRRQVTLVASLVVAAGLALPAAPAGANASTAVARLAGVDRYDTSAKVALATFNSATRVIIASGEDANFPDGLAAAALAGVYPAPVLLTPAAGLSTYTTHALATLGAHAVTIVGGTSAVSQNVADQLTAQGDSVTRVSGADRYATAAQVARAMFSAVPLGTFNGKKTVFVATGLTFPDALGAGAPAFARHLPVLLTDPATLSQSTSSELTALGAEQAVIMGGTTAVSTNVENSIKALGLSTLRIAGANRFDTAAQLASFEWAPVVPGPSFNFAGIQSALPASARGFVEFVSGLNFPDAESVGPRAGTLGAAIILDDPLPPESKNWLGTYQANIATVEAVGGENAVPAADLTAAQSAASPSGGTGTISGLAGETAFSVALSGSPDSTTEVPSAFKINNASLPAGVTCTAVETLVCTGLPTALKGGDLISMNTGAITSTDGKAYSVPSFTVPNATAPTVTSTQFLVGGTDFNITFSRPITTSTLNSSTVKLSGTQTIDFSTSTDNGGGGLIPSATPQPTSFTFRMSGPITSGETLTLTTGITDNSSPPLAMQSSNVVTATPDNTSPTPTTTTHETVDELSSVATGTVGGISITAKKGTLADGVNGNNFFVQVATNGLSESTTIASNSNCTTSNTAAVASQYCVSINTGGLTGASLTNALASDSTFSSVFIGSVTGTPAAAGPTALSGGATAVGAVLVLNKPLDSNAAAGLGTYALDVLGDGNQNNATFTGIVGAVDNGAAPTIVVAIFQLKATAPNLTASTKLDVQTAPVDFVGHALTPLVIAIS